MKNTTLMRLWLTVVKKFRICTPEVDQLLLIHKMKKTRSHAYLAAAYGGPNFRICTPEVGELSFEFFDFQEEGHLTNLTAPCGGRSNSTIIIDIGSRVHKKSI